MRRAASAALAGLCALGCPQKHEPAPRGGATATSAPPSPSDDGSRSAIDLLEHFDDFSLGLDGPLVDLGDPTARAALGVKARANAPVAIERDGATWAKVTTKSLGMTLVLDGDPPAEAIASARVRGGSAKSISVYVNDKPAGTWPLSKGDVKLVETRLPEGALQPGANELLLRFNGAGKTSAEELAELDWVHLGGAGSEGRYAAPTRSDVIASATLGGVPRRGISLRAPGWARYSGMLPSGGWLEGQIALVGATDGEIEVRLARDRQTAVPLASYRLTAADAAAWKTVKVPLGDLGEPRAMGALVIAVKSVTKGGRIFFGEPRLVTPAPASAPAAAQIPASRGVVLVVLGDTSPRGLALYGGPRALPELGALAASGVAFDAHRATTTIPPGAFASMLTGKEALAHGISDYDRKLPADVTTLADAARQGSVVAAMFTANPLTGAAYGFDRAWETYEMYPPSDDTPATAIFDRATRWLEQHKADRFLLVLHARGGHPPWDITTDELKTIPPEQYTGGIDPKHAAELLAKARRVPPAIRWGEQDKVRTWALYDLALAAHDEAIGRLVAQLKALGRAEDTTIIVTGDVSVDESAHVPFGDGETLDEAPLRVPLIVRPGPGAGPLAGKHVLAPTTGLDLARTVTGALGLAPPSSFGGVDLWETASRPDAPARPLLATLGERFSLRWGPFVLSGAPERDPKLCNLSLEPVCATDVRSTHPLATSALTREAIEVLATLPQKPIRETPNLDAAAASAVKAWGR